MYAARRGGLLWTGCTKQSLSLAHPLNDAALSPGRRVQSIGAADGSAACVPLAAIDPNRDDGRDEGEDRLVRLRPLLRMAATRHPGLIDAASETSLAACLGTPPGGGRDAVHDALLAPTAPWKPQVRLVAPDTALYDIATIDEGTIDNAIDEEHRTHACYAVRGQRKVAVLLPEGPCNVRAPPSIALEFPRRRLGISAGAKSAQGRVRLCPDGPHCATLHVARRCTRAPRSSARGCPRRCSTGCLRACRARRSR